MVRSFFRDFQFKRLRLINLMWRAVNLLKVRALGIKCGKHLCIDGKTYFRLSTDATVRIGKHCYISSGNATNALCSNRRAAIRVDGGASLTIGDNFGASSPVIWVAESVTIGDNVKLGANCIIIDTDAHSLDFEIRRITAKDRGKTSPINIGDDVLIGVNCIVLKGVTIGSRTIVGAGSIVTHDLPEDCIAAGNPAKVIKKLKADS